MQLKAREKKSAHLQEVSAEVAKLKASCKKYYLEAITRTEEVSSLDKELAEVNEKECKAAAEFLKGLPFISTVLCDSLQDYAIMRSSRLDIDSFHYFDLNTTFTK